MTERRQTILAKLLAEDSDNIKDIPYRRRQAIGTLAAIIAEEEQLQADIDENGMTYKTTGDKGQHIEKKRPAYEELGRLRDRKLRFSKELGLNLHAAFADDF